MNAASKNYSQAELDKFDELAQRWWDPGGPQKALHALNPARLGYVAERVALRDAAVLDVGCGGGLLSEAMAQAGANVTAIDLAPNLLKVARLHGLESGVKVDYQAVSAEDLAAREPAGFDVVTCMEMLEHVPDPGSIIQACATLVKPGGWVFFSTLNRNPKSFLFAIVGAEYILRMLPKGTHSYESFIKPSELTAAARRAGLAVHELMGMQYNPLVDVYKLSPDTSVNYLVACRREA